MSDGYELAALLKIRAQQQEDAEEEYAREIQELQRRERFVQQKQQELAAREDARRAACIEHDQKRFAGALTMVEIQRFDGYLDGLRVDETNLKEEIERAGRSCEQQQTEVARAKQGLIEATKELKAVQKHRENWQSDQAREQARRDSAAMDEVAARLWMEHKR